MARRRVAVLISGSGSNLEALARACADETHPCEIALVISNKEDAFGLVRAERLGLTNRVIDHRSFADRAAFDAALHSCLVEHSAELVCLAGFMRVLSAAFVRDWHNRLLNVHPSLLPAFEGLDTHRRALDTGVAVAGCTVHLVRADLDRGPILVQGIAAVLQGDDEGKLAARVHELEHRCYPLALRMWGSGALRCDAGDNLIETANGRRFAAPLLVHPTLAAADAWQ